MNPLDRRISKIEMRDGNRMEMGEPPSSWFDVYIRLAAHVPRKRPPAPAVPMSPEDAYQAMTERRDDPDEPKAPETWWRWYMAKLS